MRTTALGSSFNRKSVQSSKAPAGAWKLNEEGRLGFLEAALVKALFFLAAVVD